MKPIIDFIVPHHKEPWEVGRKFFHMLSMQRNVNFNQIRVTVVQDGKEGALNWEDLFRTCPYPVKVLTIDHGGPAAARNAGLQQSDAEWVMFCDFDDMFCDVYSVSMIVNVLPTDEADILWMECYREQSIRANSVFVNCVEENFSESFGKLFRRSFLNEHNLFFPDMPYNVDYVFCYMALACVRNTRVLKIRTKFNMYTKTLRRDSYTMSRDSIAKNIECLFYGNVYLVHEFEERKMPHDMTICIANTIYTAYFMLNSTPKVPHHSEISGLFREFCDKYYPYFLKIRKTEMEIIEQDCNCRMINTVGELYNNFLLETITPDTGYENVRKWVESFMAAPPEPTDPSDRKKNLHVVKDSKESTTPAPSDERVVVYTGTRNVYENIQASMKSLFANSRVDHVYLMIEDDAFPYDTPDCVTVMNVSDQTFFPKSGPNYECAWSYMCMMRAAFTKLLPQHDRVLSLDIDTVITDNIDELWDTDISDYYLAGVHEKDRGAADYINFGVVMMNLAAIRRDHIDEKTINVLNTSRQQCPEQDAFNRTCAGHILLLDSRFNYTPFTNLIAPPEREIIIHYAGIQFWKNFSAVQKYMNMPWSEILISKPQSGRKRKVAVYCGTKEIYHMMAASAKSLLYHTPMDKIYFLIEHDTFPEPLPDCIECINVHDQTFFPEDGANANSQVTYMDLMRLALPLVLENEPLVLSLDMDVLIENDISALWDYDMSEQFLACVPETRNNHNPRQPYYNFGVCLMNLDRLRKTGMVHKLINAANTKKYDFYAQDCINDVLYNQILPLPSRYNRFGCTDPTDIKDIEHYAGPASEKLAFAKDSQKYVTLPWNNIITHGKENQP